MNTMSQSENSTSVCVQHVSPSITVSTLAVDGVPILSITPYDNTLTDVRDGWIKLSGWYTKEGVHTAMSTTDGRILYNVECKSLDDEMFETNLIDIFVDTEYDDEYNPEPQGVRSYNYNDCEDTTKFDEYVFPDEMKDPSLVLGKDLRFDFRVNWIAFDREILNGDDDNDELYDEDNMENYHYTDYNIDYWSDSDMNFYIISTPDKLVVAVIKDTSTELQEGDDCTEFYMFKDGNILLVNRGDVSSCIHFKNNKKN